MTEKTTPTPRPNPFNGHAWPRSMDAGYAGDVLGALSGARTLVRLLTLNAEQEAQVSDSDDGEEVAPFDAITEHGLLMALETCLAAMQRPVEMWANGEDVGPARRRAQPLKVAA
jgi:hypothetical protein